MLLGMQTRLSPTLTPLEDEAWERADVILRDASGRAIFEQKDVECPTAWAEISRRTAVHKYFSGNIGQLGREDSIKGMINRVSSTISAYAHEGGYFETDAESRQFYAELTYLYLKQMFSPNSPVWFNVGVDSKPQCSACYIIGVDDNMESIEEWMRTEMEIFRRGSGAGANLSRLRGSMEHLSKGGIASGPNSFAKAADFNCGAMKSGGKARRGAKLYRLNCDHPDFLEFLDLKEHAEGLVTALVNAGYNSDWENGVYKDIPWQNANNSGGAFDRFLQAVRDDQDWSLIARVDGRIVATHRARDIWERWCRGAWACGCPGIQFDDTINKWHTCKADAPIRSSNPCSEYMFIDDTSCNLGSVNLIKFLRTDGSFNISKFRQTLKIAAISMDAVIDNAHYPNEKIDVATKQYRTLGVGYSNLGGLLMRTGKPYDSDEGRLVAAGVTSLMTGQVYLTSTEMSERLGSFERYHPNRDSMLEVMEMHRQYARELHREYPEDPTISASMEVWDEVLGRGEIHGFRNAQATVLAPCGTIGFLMGCDTTSIEPELGLVKTKQIVGGSSELIVNESVGPGLRSLGYDEDSIEDIRDYVMQKGTMEGCKLVKTRDLPIFDTSLPPRDNPDGRVIHYRGHLRMMAAAQPSISGAISKTVNTPSKAGWEEISSAYMMAWELGLKAVAVYRDASKKSQPVVVGGKSSTAQVVGAKPIRMKLPEIASAKRIKICYGQTDIYIHTAVDETGKLRECFFRANPSGATLGGLLDTLGITLSNHLQYDGELKSLMLQWKKLRYEPSAHVLNPITGHRRFYPSISACIADILMVMYCDPEIREEQEFDASSIIGPLDYTGMFCDNCHMPTIQVGTCQYCPNCQSNTGCS